MQLEENTYEHVLKVLETFPNTPGGGRELRQAGQSGEDVKNPENIAKSTITRIWTDVRVLSHL